jgi:hypothetical protein
MMPGSGLLANHIYFGDIRMRKLDSRSATHANQCEFIAGILEPLLWIFVGAMAAAVL